MRPHPKLRKSVKWGGAAASVLLAVALVGSAWWTVKWQSASGSFVSLERGAFWIRWYEPSVPFGLPAFTVYPTPEPGIDRRSRSVRSQYNWVQSIPLWMPAAPLLLITAAAWWLDRRSRRWALIGACTKCGYDRAGIAAGAVCPECGAAPGAASGSQK